MAQKRNSKKINYVKEVRKLIRDFFRRDFIRDNILIQPRELKEMYKKMNITKFIMNGIVFNFLSFLTLAGNYAIEKGFGIIGILLYLIYFGRNIVHTLYNQWDRNLSSEIEFKREDSLTIAGSKILQKVTNHIYQKKDNQWNQCSNEQITNCIADYLLNTWDVQNNYLINIGQIISTLIMLTATVLTNRTIPQSQFIPLLISSSIITLLCCAYDRYHHSNFIKEINPLSDEKAMIKNDILRVVPITAKDQDVRIKRYQNLSHKQFTQKRELIKKDFGSDLLSSAVHIISSYILVLTYIRESGEITLATIAGMTASLAIFNSAVSSFGDIIRVFTSRSKSWDSIEKREELTKEILKIYHKETSSKPISIDSLTISPFEIMYNEISENDKPFSLCLEETVQYQKGDCIALTGASGSGKSTFLKVTTNRIKFNHVESTTIPPVNYMYYDETIDFGNMPIWDEIFCLDSDTASVPTPEEISKMEYILKELKLYYEISENCKDFWRWIKENKASSLSRGQKQRLIIAKILFWLDQNIDIVALDECTSGLDSDSLDEDNADAIKILQFIIDYCNRDKKRILFISTHQNVDELCNHKLHFKRNNGKTVIKKIY